MKGASGPLGSIRSRNFKVILATTYGNYAVEYFMFNDPERRHETEITIRGLKQVFIFYSDIGHVVLSLKIMIGGR